MVSSYLYEVGTWMVIVFGTAFYGITIGFVYIHASSHDRSTWFWMLVAAIPIVGVIIYLAYFHWKTSPTNLYNRTRRKEKVGRRLTKTNSRSEREHIEAIAILANFRDKEIERFFIEGGDADDVRETINSRGQEATERGDKTAIEAYDFYRRSLEEYRITQEVPRIILKLWGLLKETDPPEPPENGPKQDEIADGEAESCKLPVTFVDQEKRYGLGDKKV